MRIFVLGSGSSGNCAVIEAEGERVVLDAGMNPTVAAARMRELGAELVTRKPALAVVVSHDHGDHSSHAGPLARALSAPLFVQRGMENQIARAKQVEVRTYAPGQTLFVGPFVIDSLLVPHDAPQVALRVSTGAHAFAIATDLGHVSPTLVPFLGACDVALVESNYCSELLEWSSYPPRLKQRVRGLLGHLSNAQTADLAAALARTRTRLRRLVLGHLSLSNNTPERALATVAPRCPDLPVDVVPHGVARLLTVDATSPTVGAQLALPFRAC
jgi:phosphoribosyl 1,2-cyclic phosphodiesterase